VSRRASRGSPTAWPRCPAPTGAGAASRRVLDVSVTFVAGAASSRPSCRGCASAWRRPAGCGSPGQSGRPGVPRHAPSSGAGGGPATAWGTTRYAPSKRSGRLRLSDPSRKGGLTKREPRTRLLTSQSSRPPAVEDDEFLPGTVPRSPPFGRRKKCFPPRAIRSEVMPAARPASFLAARTSRGDGDGQGAHPDDGLLERRVLVAGPVEEPEQVAVWPDVEKKWRRPRRPGSPPVPPAEKPRHSCSRTGWFLLDVLAAQGRDGARLGPCWPADHHGGCSTSHAALPAPLISRVPCPEAVGIDRLPA